MMLLLDRCLHWVARKPIEAFFIAFGLFNVAFWPIAVAFPDWKVLSAVALIGTGLIVGAVCLLVRTVRTRCYYPIVLTWDAQYKTDTLAEVKRFFARIHVPSAKARPLVKVGTPSGSDWRDSLVQAVSKMEELRANYDEVHLACQAYWMWCFALGTDIQDRHPLLLYHYQNGTYYRIWTISREIKNRKAVAPTNYQYSVCAPASVQDGQRTDAVVLVVACGSHDPTSAVSQYAQANLPGVPIHAVRLERGLDPTQPDRWIGAAADLAITVDELSGSGSKELYLFGTMPDTLALMAGSAVGPYRRIRLMQYHDGSYFEATYLQPKPLW